MGRATARARIEEPPALSAPLFRSLLERKESERVVVLDLGAATTPMLSLLGRFRSHVQIADLAGDRDVLDLNATVPGNALDDFAEYCLPAHCTTEPLDLAFCWDLPNYLKPEATTALMRAIAARSRAGTVAHALIVYSERSMPDRPRYYVPNADGTLVNHAVAARVVDAPRYSPEALGTIMAPFVIDRARLLANGMQEFLFRLP